MQPTSIKCAELPNLQIQNKKPQIQKVWMSSKCSIKKSQQQTQKRHPSMGRERNEGENIKKTGAKQKKQNQNEGKCISNIRRGKEGRGRVSEQKRQEVSDGV